MARIRLELLFMAGCASMSAAVEQPGLTELFSPSTILADNAPDFDEEMQATGPVTAPAGGRFAKTMQDAVQKAGAPISVNPMQRPYQRTENLCARAEVAAFEACGEHVRNSSASSASSASSEAPLCACCDKVTCVIPACGIMRASGQCGGPIKSLTSAPILVTKWDHGPIDGAHSRNYIGEASLHLPPAVPWWQWLLCGTLLLLMCCGMPAMYICWQRFSENDPDDYSAIKSRDPGDGEEGQLVQTLRNSERSAAEAGSPLCQPIGGIDSEKPSKSAT